MSKTIRLRRWQREALDGFIGSDSPDYLAVATPGSGKTTFGLTAARHHLAEHPSAPLIVVVPTQHLKHQWSSAALAFGLHLTPAWQSSDNSFPSDMHGIATTYQQVASCPELLNRLCVDSFVILDEVHHAGDERAWGDGVSRAFENAARRLSLSGTPFRSDTQAIPFVKYEYDEAIPDHEYGYGDALADRGVVRPIHFPRVDGHMEWTAPDGSFHSHGFGDSLDAARASQRLRTALSLEGQWLPTVLGRAHNHLKEIRRTHPDAGGLVIAIDVDHARAIAQLLEDSHNASVIVATSDDPQATRRIARFSAGREEWIVAVRMVSEGVDIPRLRVGVFATNTNTELFFRQAIGRLVRYTRGIKNQRAYLYIPDDPRLRTKAAQIREQRRHSLHRMRKDDDSQLIDLTENNNGERDEVISQYSVISAVAFDEESSEEDEYLAESEEPTHEDNNHFEIELAPPPHLGGSTDLTKTRNEIKADLRAENTKRVRELVALSGLSHAGVNKELNKRAGIDKVTKATTEELERRLKCADSWLTKLVRSSGV